jgi:hypothetical protein
MKPAFEALVEISSRLNSANIIFALGGSGMLAALGLTQEVHDWDITTDANWSEVEPVLVGLNYQMIATKDPYASKYLCKIQMDETSIDLIGTMAIVKDGIKREFQTVVDGKWRGIPLSSIEPWIGIYQALGRTEKANLLLHYQRST